MRRWTKHVQGYWVSLPHYELREGKRLVVEAEEADLETRHDFEIIEAAVNALFRAADKVNMRPLEYAILLNQGVADIRGRCIAEVEGHGMQEGFKGGGVFEGRSLRFETTDLDTVKRIVDWDAMPSRSRLMVEKAMNNEEPHDDD